MKLLAALITLLVGLPALAGPPIIWNGADAKLINSGSLLAPGGGTASTPGLIVSGTPYAAGSATTNKPQLLIEPLSTTSTGWSTSGTLLGVNGATGFTGNLADFQVSGTSKASIDKDGLLVQVSGSETVKSGAISSTRFTLNNSTHANSTFFTYAINTGALGLGVGTFSNDWPVTIPQSSANTTPLSGIVSGTYSLPLLNLRNTSSTANNYSGIVFSGSSDNATSTIVGINEVHTTNSESGRLEFNVKNAGTMALALKINKDKTVNLSGYGAGILQTDSSGLVSVVAGIPGRTRAAKSGDFTVGAGESGYIYILDTSAARAITLPTPVADFYFTVIDKTGNASANGVTYTRVGTEKIFNLAQNYVVNEDFFSQTWITDGTDWFLLK